jgi:sterol desaturase/sphingolipid hydroxylase (fatty acid hydroxylase superfamily)
VNRHRRVDLGKRAGVTAGLLGVLCVIAEFCFLFPDLLVTRDALPFYRANLNVFRGILWTAIAATFVLGAFSLVLLRSKLHGLLALGLGGVALAMRFTDSVETGPAAVSAGLDYFVLELLVLGLLFIPLERLAKLRAQKIFRKGWQTDLKHFFVSHAGVQILSFATLIPANAFFTWAIDSSLQRAVASQPVWLQFIELLLAADLVTYWVHRAFHQLPFLWNFHAIHHSSQEMDWLAGSRTHLVDALLTRSLTFVPIFVLGFSQAALVAYVAFVSFHAVYIHSNTRWRFPVLRWIIATPEFHHWHHTSDEEGIDKNFAAFLPLWDRIFGTAHMPDHWPKKYGTVKFQPPESYLGQLAYPFRRKRETPYG